MNYVEFAERCKSRFNYQDNPEINVLHCLLGVLEESGEICGYFKKKVGYQHDLNRTGIIGELGDIMWYTTMLTIVLEYEKLDNYEKVSKQLNAAITIKKKDSNKKLTLEQLSIGIFRIANALSFSIEKGDSNNTQMLVEDMILYCNIMASRLETSLPKILDLNEKKLSERHKGDSFNPESTYEENRDREKEDEALGDN